MDWYKVFESMMYTRDLGYMINKQDGAYLEDFNKGLSPADLCDIQAAQKSTDSNLD